MYLFTATARRRFFPSAFTLVELLVVIAIIGILVALLLPAIQAAREAARRAQCEANIHNVALAVINYESTKKIFPNGMSFDPSLAGQINALPKFGPNWIIDVLPYMEDQALRDAFDPASLTAPYSVPINDTTTTSRAYKARGSAIPVLLCPSDGNNKVLYQGAPGSTHGGNWARTNYAGNAGRSFLYPAAANPTPGTTTYANGPDSDAWKNDCQRGVMGPNVGVKLRRVVDGTSKTFMVVEIRVGPTEQDARGVWALGHAGASLVAAYGSGADDNGPNFCDPNADDVYSNICGGVDQMTGEEMAGGCMPCYQGTVFDQATARSNHSGGIFVAMCDGSVQFISNDIETSGKNGSCCTPWDRYISSGDGDRPGAANPGYNGRSPTTSCAW